MFLQLNPAILVSAQQIQRPIYKADEVFLVPIQAFL